eukprot:CAMPEP_0171642270 /NCGR_PEP_ID=MMETSP0990-20121206/31831_1 /TAXON_ID=483369 /ORGANISM="non described non described, Strain CCMP2098" /LENGTH=107 /DNA_ID=CAMNT_0012217411 /DNA_START=65 /DNA_END=385 /DNA_ORIENTATION=+
MSTRNQGTLNHCRGGCVAYLRDGRVVFSRSGSKRCGDEAGVRALSRVRGGAEQGASGRLSYRLRQPNSSSWKCAWYSNFVFIFHTAPHESLSCSLAASCFSTRRLTP